MKLAAGNRLAFAAYAAASSLLFLLLVEGSLRLAGIRPALPPVFSMDYAAPHPVLGFAAVPGSRWSFYVTPNGGPAVRKTGSVDASGFRPIVANAECHGCPELLVLGDSLTFGAESADDETWPELLARELARHGHRYKVRNVSFRGYNTLQIYLALKATLATRDNVAIAIYLFSPNDPFETFYPADGVPAPLLETGPSEEIAIRRPDGPETKRWHPSRHLGRLDAVKYNLATFGLLARVFDVESYRSAREQQTMTATDDDYRRFWTRAGPAADGSRYRTLATVADYLDLLLDDDDESLAVQRGIARLLRAMAEETERAGVDLHVAFLPFGPFTAGPTGEEFARLLGLEPLELEGLRARWTAFGRRVEELTREAGGRHLPIDPDLFAGMSFREYAAQPEDWHYSAAANGRLAACVAASFLPRLGDRAADAR